VAALAAAAATAAAAASAATAAVCTHNRKIGNTDFKITVPLLDNDWEQVCTFYCILALFFLTRRGAALSMFTQQTIENTNLKKIIATFI